MNFLKKGPELKAPDLKVPDFLLDIYYDLRERHLLPLVAILIAALVAVPFLLGGGSSESEPGASEGAIATPSAALPTSKLLVAKSAPGLRDYRRRLANEHAKDPFVQQYSNEGGGESGGAEGAPGGGEESSVTVEPSEPSTGTTEGAQPAEEGNGEPPEGGQLKYYSWAIDVRVTPVSSGKGKDKPQASVRHDLPDMTMLPSRDVPALTFIGVTKDAKRAVMLVSDKVTGLFGDGICIVGSEACQLIALEPGLPETVVYGANSRTYRIELLKLRLLKSDQLNVAPLGKKPKQKSSGKPEEAG
ncbi:MAG: hypothetical protein QOF13_1382 [Solirubrobacterales bacterium]|jgi:hypothetical protein|nr:hypothetical protein [Solirubrobacterales bacterium]